MRVDIARGVVKLSELPEGSLFKYKNTVALKSVHWTESGACKCFIVGTGKMFWDDAKTAKELNNLYVTPILFHDK